MRDLEYLYAATDDDAYNALVCTRFAGEMGRERVHQPPPAAEREHLQTSREWRGKYAPHAVLTHARLSELVADGYGFAVHEGDDAPPEGGSSERWPVLAVTTAGALSFRSPDDEFDVEMTSDQRTVWFEKIRPSAPRRRRWRLRNSPSA